MANNYQFPGGNAPLLQNPNRLPRRSHPVFLDTILINMLNGLGRNQYGN